MKTIAPSFYSLLFLATSFSFLFPSCLSKPKAPTDNAFPSDTASGVYVCSEGNFQWSNATLGWFQSKSKNFSGDIFRKVNQRGLGDVLQSACLLNNQLYLIVNNSGKIEVTDATTIESKCVISGFTSPRYLLPWNDTLAFVSDLYANGVWLVNLNTKQITGKIPLRGWTEEMVKSGQELWVCGRGGSYVYVINPMTRQLADSVETNFAPQHIVSDNKGKLWVLCNGGNGNNAKLYCIDPITKAIEKSLVIGPEATASRLVTDAGKCHLYWTAKQSLYRMGTEEAQMPAQPWVTRSGGNFYGLGYDPYRHQVFASDAKDYVQASEVMQFDTNGVLQNSFRAGINVSYFLAKP